MILREPMVEFVQLISSDIGTDISGAGYNVCQFTGYTTVRCEKFTITSVSETDLCGQSDCAKSSDAVSQYDWNDPTSCDFGATP